MLLQLVRDAVDLPADIVVLVDIFLDVVLHAEQAGDQAGRSFRVDAADIELAQLLHHAAQRIAGRACILGPTCSSMLSEMVASSCCALAPKKMIELCR